MIWANIRLMSPNPLKWFIELRCLCPGSSEAGMLNYEGHRVLIRGAMGFAGRVHVEKLQRRIIKRKKQV